jgi:hypothetical protein
MKPTRIYPYSTPDGIRELVPLEDYEALKKEYAAELAHWKANHDNQRTIKAALTQRPDYGEPWSEQPPPHPITKGGGVYWLNPEQFNRAVTCVNACAGMVDPDKEVAALKQVGIANATMHLEAVDAAAEIAAMREAIREAHDAIKASPYPDQQALTKLQPYITP